MADITITPASIQITANTVKATGTSGVAITAGQAVYLDPSTGLVRPARADSASTTNSPNLLGVALDSAPGANQPITYAVSGDVIYGGGLTQSQVYVVSPAVAGNIAPNSDITGSGMFAAVLGVARSATVLRLGVMPDTIQHL